MQNKQKIIKAKDKQHIPYRLFIANVDTNISKPVYLFPMAT